MSVSRVLPLGTLEGEDRDEQLQNGLAVLMPLSFDNDWAGFADPMVELRRNLDGIRPDLHHLLDVAENGAEAVHSAMNEALRAHLKLALGDEP